MRHEWQTKTKNEARRRRQPASVLSEAGAGIAGHRRRGHGGIRVSVSRAECALRAVTGGECRQARPLSAGHRHPRRELRHLHHPLGRGLFLAERGLHASGLPDRVEAGIEHDCLPVPRQQVREDGKKIEGPAPKPLPWKRIWLNDDGDLLVDRSTDVPPLARDSFVRV